MSTPINAQRDVLIAQAVKDRKIAAHDVGKYRRWYDGNPAAYAHLLTASVEHGGLMPGLVPEGESAPDGYPKEWLGGNQPTGAVVFEEAAPSAGSVVSDAPAAAPSSFPLATFEER